MTFVEYKQQLLEYLNHEKEIHEEEINTNKSLSDNEKIEAGLLIKSVIVEKENCLEYILSVSENETKMRPGDKVTLIGKNNHKISCTIIENGMSFIILKANERLYIGNTYRLEVDEYITLDPLIKLIKKIELGLPGSDFIEILAGLRQPEKEGFLPIENKIAFEDNLNESQRLSCESIVKCPSFFCIQGPPGTGKTEVLSTIAKIFSADNCQVLVLAKTHQAVNNALNSISCKIPNAYVYKIGENLKSNDLLDHVKNFQTYDYYIQDQKKRNGGKTDIIGMTLQSAIINIGLRHKSFLPYIILIDEASQIPLVEAACIGTFGAATIVFIGDEKQMPPIYNEKQINDQLSKSIFEYLCEYYPAFKQMLNITYRMNEEITDYVSSRFYEHKLIVSDVSKNRHLILNAQNEDQRINYLLSSSKSILNINVSKEMHEDENDEEALFISNLVREAIKDGLSPKDIAIITPFRRQVRCIREYVIKSISCELPLIDTVERLQGQDVDLIIVSCTTTSPEYFRRNETFLTSPNRWNVMISRAKKKVIIVGTNYSSYF